MSKGFIKLNRGLLDHWVGDDPDVFLVWVRLLLKANFRDKKAFHKGKLTEYKRGCVYISIRDFAAECGMGRKKLLNVLEALKRDQMVDHRGDNLGTTISICNYDAYQLQNEAEEPQRGQQRSHAGATQEPEGDTTKKDKNIYNTLMSNSEDREKAWSEFWDSYGRKVGTGAARKSWEKAIKSESHLVILEAAKSHAASLRKDGKLGSKFHPHASTWLNQQRWMDEPAAREDQPSASRPEDRYQWGEHEQDGFVWRVPLLDGNVLHNMSMWQKIREVGA